MEDFLFMFVECRDVEEAGYDYEILDSVPLTNINDICLVVPN
jgi:hypothetical protein